MKILESTIQILPVKAFCLPENIKSRAFFGIASSCADTVDVLGAS